MPLRYEDETTPISEDFTRQVRQALDNLRDKQDVTVRFIGYTDDAPLTGRDERIYGDHLSLSKARAHRVALAMQETLGLPTSAIESDGRGATRPLASNETVQGRALNRRVEVEFWYDDPLQELPDEPQLCPGDAGDEMVTRVYDPPWGTHRARSQLANGQPIIPPGYAANLRRALTDIADRTNARLRFIGYTKNERLDRRTASVYGDDIGLSAARARRAMDIVMQDPLLSGARSEHEGRGYVQSDDVVNAGFIQGETSFVRVQVVYDEPLPLDDYEGVDITRLTQELRPKSPYELNVMRITVDGKPIDDPGRSSSDIQRCTDVALDNAKIQFRFDNLESRPRLGVAAHPVAVAVSDVDGVAASVVRFRMYNNYSSFIERAEIRIFEQQQSLQAVPLAIIAVDDAGLAEWQPARRKSRGPGARAQVRAARLRREGSFRRNGRAAAVAVPRAVARTTSRAVRRGAAARAAGRLRRERPGAPADSARQRHGEGAGQRHTGGPHGLGGGPPGSGRPAGQLRRGGDPSDGAHTVEVAVLDDAGNGSLYLRDLEFKRSDLLLRRRRRPHGVREPRERAGRAAAGRERSAALRFVAGRPAGVLRERQGQRALAADGERGYPRRPGGGPVQQLPRQVARFAVPAHRSRLLLPDVRRRRRRGGDGADARASSTSKRAAARTTGCGATSRSATWTTSWPTSIAACTEPTRTTGPKPPPASASDGSPSTDSPPSPERCRATRNSAERAGRSTSCATRTS